MNAPDPDECASLQTRVAALEQKLQQCQSQLQACTQQRQQLEQLEHQNQHLEDLLFRRTTELRTLIDAIPEYIFVVDRANMQITHCNDTFAHGVCGLPRNQVEGKTIFDCFAPDYAEYFTQQNNQVFVSGQVLRIQEQISFSNGSYFFDTIKVPLKHADGEVYALVGAARDITALKQMESSLRQSEELFRRLFEEAPIGLAMTPLSSHHLFRVNRMFCEMLGYTPDEFAHLNFTDITYPADLALEMPLAEQAIAGVTTGYQLEKRYIKKNGEIFWGHLTTATIHGAEGHPLYGLGMVQDITERKRAETALQQQTQRVQQELVERRQVEEKLRSSLQEKEVLLKEIHHRVKNNMQMVSSLLNLQANSIRDPEVLQPFIESQRRIKVMALIHEKLYQSPNLAQIRFADYVQQLAEDLLQAFGQQLPDVQLNVDVADVELTVDIAIPCGLIINELVSNALKYAFPGGKTGAIQIWFQLAPDSSSDQSLYALAVQDNGIGIPEAIDWQTTESLGLQLVMVLAQKLQGTLTLDRNNGSTFQVIFPLLLCEQLQP